MSFPNTGGATLALPSPTHAHQIDVTSAVRSLRRSISRSPSKFLSRTNSHSSEGSPQSPCRRFGATPQHHRQPSQAQTQSAPPASLASATSTQSPLATPFRPNVKLSLRSAKSTKTLTPTRSVARTRVSPKSPMKRTSNTPDSASRTPIFAPLSALEFHEQENRHFGQQSPATRTGLDRPSRHSCHLDISGASQMFLKTLDTPSTSTPSSPIPPSGTLKRSDATMNLEEPTQGSPVAKRRSLHGISNHQMEDLGIFGTVRAASPNQGFEIHEDSGSEYELGTTPRDPLPSPTPGSHLPKRTSSLRKSTLQQRYGDKGSLGRKTGERHLASMGTDPATPVQTRPRVSNDQFTPLPLPPPRDSIFSQASPLPNPSIHAMDFKRHPLSQFQTASSSGSSLKEQTALYTSVKPPPIAATTSINFAQSLPLNAPRPTARVANLHTEAVATPGRTNLAGTGAFHSTGLISKVNHNPEDEATRMVPPDTPCKKPSHLFNTYPLPPGSAFKAKPTKPNRNSFAGVPSTPYHAAPHETPGTFGNTDRGLSIFFRGNASRNARRGSLLSLEGEESQLPGDTADVTDPIPGEVPPTPTRNTLTPSLSNVTESSLESPSAHRTLPQAPMSAVRPPFSRESTCKSTPREPGLSDLTEDEVRLGVSQPVGLDNRQSPTPRLSFSSFGRARARRGLSSPAPLSTAQPSILPLKPSKSVFAKIASFDSASPVEGRRTPQTPQGNLSVETGFLSMAPPGEARADSSMQPPPVTPTTDRDFRSSASIFVTPVNFRTSTMDLDPTLKRRFEDVEEIGSGEFSLVYRVTKVHRPSAAELFDATPARGQMASPAKPQIFAVKQSKHQFQGYKDRQLKLREVEVLQALRDAEHVVQYVDHWEHNFHLFIQTEFCEEGTLKNFLTHVGQSARLDDFRIFKILQDLCLGLKEIHDAGFMHLDMKPANILITFEGALKIGDFGLAQAYPATGETEEGDREYMAPEVLGGRVTQSADTFSLGLMTLEAAANVVLPNNGTVWANLRSGDLSDVPSLTWNPSSDVQRDATGNPTESGHSDGFQNDYTHDAGNLFGSLKRSELPQPPDFMVDPNHHSSLDQVVRWMTARNPEQRPTADQVLDLEGLRWVAEHRTAPATVYEGNWGPAEPLPVMIAGDSDTEMTDA